MGVGKVERVYFSKVDWWIAAILAGTLLFCLALGIYLFNKDPLVGMASLAIGLFMTTLIVLIGIPCKYTLFDEFLEVQAGILKHVIRYEDITEITKTRNPLSAPAFSLKRIKIRHGKKFILISPKDRDEFINDLKARM